MQELTLSPTPMGLIESAIAKGDMQIDTLERLMALQERWEKTQAEKAFNEAFNLFQQNKPLVKHDAKATLKKEGKIIGEYDHSTLQGIQKVVDPVLSQFGLSYTFKQFQNDGKIKITCVLKHSLGHKEETSLESNSDKSGMKNEIQAIGSAVSYLKRYTLLNALGMSTGKDDDGQATTLTKEEIQEAELSKLVELFAEKEGKLKEKEKERLNVIISTHEVSSYGKAIKTLKAL